MCCVVAGCAAACCRVASVQAVLKGKQPSGCVKLHWQLGIKLSYIELDAATNTLHTSGRRWPAGRLKATVPRSD